MTADGPREVNPHPSNHLPSALQWNNTNSPWLYAIDDINGRNPLTHMAVCQSRAAALTVLARARRGVDVEPEAWSKYAATADHEICTQFVFTDPSVASVGLTAEQGKKKGIAVKEVLVPFHFPEPRIHAELNYDGWAQRVIDGDKGLLVCATVVGREGADLLHASTLAIVGQIPIEKL